jgi:alkylhydroperoxidase family enzyme
MFLIDYVKPEKAHGKVEEIYNVFPPHIGVPAPLQLLSASPDLLEAHMAGMKRFMTHDRLTPGLLAAIRYTVASREDYGYCVKFNDDLLQAAGASAAEVEELKRNPDHAAMLEESEQAMLAFTLKALYESEKVSEADIAGLRDQGWRDSDILDAVVQGANMIAAGRLFKAFSK